MNMETVKSHNASRTGSIELDTMPDKVSRTVPEHVREALRRTKLEQFDTLARAQEEIERLQARNAELLSKVNELSAENAILNQRYNEAEQKLFFIHGGAKDIQAML